MDAQQAWGDARSDRGPRTISSRFQGYGIYIFLISFTCVYYFSNAQLLLGHYDLGWHLAAGDLIREQGHIPFQDPWSFTSAGRQWYNLSWLWDVIASVIFQYAGLSGISSRSACAAAPRRPRSVFRLLPRACSIPLLRPPRMFIWPLRPILLPCCFA